MAFEKYFMEECGNQSVVCFDCNICLESAREPVVTLCGHLYCWGCIFKWLYVRSASLSSDEHPPQCPVCKAEISHKEMVPLYGRGLLSSSSFESSSTEMVPPRPTALTSRAILNLSPHTRTLGQLPYRNPYQTPHRYNLSYEENTSTSTSASVPAAASLLSPPVVSFGSAGFHHSMVGMFGEMLYTRLFGNSEGVGYPNSYHFVTTEGSSTTRMRRRQEMQADKSLNRISIFLFCCFLLCLIVF